MPLTASPPSDFLPDFCRGPAVFTLLLVSQITAILILLLGPTDSPLISPRLVLVSLFLHWITLLSAGALCITRRYLSQAPAHLTAALAFLLLLTISGLVSELAYQLAQWLRWEPLANSSHWRFVGRNVFVAAIISALLLRYFYVLHAWRRQVQASAEARYAALQARIRPHFLFNSLNSVAALIPSQPEAAEDLLEDLSELFRAILKNQQPWNSLQEELELGRTYLRIEQLRLGNRLRLDWQVEPGLEQARLPLLSLQPLLENAIHHGIERCPDGGTLGLRIRQEKDQLIIQIRNPLAPGEDQHRGHRLAHDNIRQRLRLLYDGKAELRTDISQEEYHAELRVPL